MSESKVFEGEGASNEGLPVNEDSKNKGGRKKTEKKHKDVQQEDLEKGEDRKDSKEDAKMHNLTEKGTSCVSPSTPTCRRFRLWGRLKAHSWPGMLSKDQKEKALSENLYQRRGEGERADVEEKRGTEEPQSVSPSISLLSSLHSSVRSIVGQIGNHLYQVWQEEGRLHIEWKRMQRGPSILRAYLVL
jgi:hypothetical protein